jgi:hypothetical protein
VISHPGYERKIPKLNSKKNQAALRRSEDLPRFRRHRNVDRRSVDHSVPLFVSPPFVTEIPSAVEEGSTWSARSAKREDERG